MDTNKLKKFAVDARNKIRHGVEAKLSTLGFDANGNVPDSMKPQLMQGGSLWNGQLMTEGFYHQWMALYEAVKRHGVRDVYEEAAYTWFNRLVAIRILQKNGLISPVLTYADAARTPQIVDDARSLNRIPPMPEADRQRLMDLLDDDTKVTEQFAILITAYCHDNPIISKSFGRMADYTELLLPNNILAENGFIDDLNHTEFITDDDYKSSQLIGWLYQFYISERKDEVFAKKGKYDADEIAPATQIFTPAWIVEYMVQNTIGRIYLDNHPEAADEFKPKWKYLVDQEQRDDEHIYHFEEVTELRCADLGCGSGHIVGYMFELLFDLYLYEGYTRKEAVENILKYNLTGVDLDLRAKQLATFALLLKACQKDPSFTDGRVMPNILTMPEPIDASKRQTLFHDFFMGEETNNMLAELDEAFDLLEDAQTLGSIMKFDLSKSTLLAIRQTMEYWEGQTFVPDDVKQLIPSFKLILALTEEYTALVMNPPYMGSGKFNNTLSNYIKNHYTEGKADLATVFIQMIPKHLDLDGKYAFIVPPSWMFLSTFEKLRKGIIENESIDSLLHLSRGVFGADFGASCAVISHMKPNKETSGTYFRLIERTFQEFDQKHLRMLFEKTLENHDFKYKFSEYNKDVKDIIYSSNGAKIYYPNVLQSHFKEIPGIPLGYWVSNSDLYCFTNMQTLGDFGYSALGLTTADNNRFLRYWQEVSILKIGFGLSSNKESVISGMKWFPHNKGGGRKWYGNFELIVNWFNNGEEMKDWVVNNPNDKKTKQWSRKIVSVDYYFKESITFPRIGSKAFLARFSPKGCIFDCNGPSFFSYGDKYLAMAYMNSCVMMNFLKILSPTISFQTGDVFKVPYREDKRAIIDPIVKHNIILSKLDWDSHETSWDFSENPLVAIMKSASTGGKVDESKENSNTYQTISQKIPNQAAKDSLLQAKTVPFSSQKIPNCGDVDSQQVTEADLETSCKDISYCDEALQSLDEYKSSIDRLISLCNSADGVKQHGSTLEEAVKAFEELWTARFMQLHYNEEELNRQFINIYGLQDELTPDVPLDEITILQQGEVKIEDNQIKWNPGVIIKQLISYAVGVCMGRYRLDKMGLQIAYPNPSADDLAPYDYNGSTINIDDDGIIPLLPHDSPFSDNMLNRLSEFVRIIFGEDYLSENLNFMESCLGETLEKYFVKNFWKDHKKMYQNRPIYWLFSSKKGAFQCIAYMHRMDAYTAERVRSKYLLRYIDFLQSKVDALDARSSELSTAENRQREQLRKALDECREYHDRLQVVAEKAISFDLDDGVVVNYAKFGDVLAKIK